MDKEIHLQANQSNINIGDDARLSFSLGCSRFAPHRTAPHQLARSNMARPIAPVLVLMLVLVLVALVLARKPPPPMPPTREMTGAPGTIDPSARRPNFKIKDRLANMKSADSQTKLQACTDTCRSRNDEHLYCTWECAGASACGATVLYSYRNVCDSTVPLATHTRVAAVLLTTRYHNPHLYLHSPAHTVVP